MRTLLAAAVIVCSISLNYADATEVHLICQGIVSGTNSQPAGEHVDPNSGRTVKEHVSVPFESSVIREIRFDEATGSFWYKGSSGIGTRGITNGWVPAKQVRFSEAQINVQFESTNREKVLNVLSFGLELVVGPGIPYGVLDRYTGIWRIGSTTLNCKKIDETERRF